MEKPALGPPYLSVSARYDEIRWCFSDPAAKVLDSGRTQGSLPDFLNSWERGYSTLGLGVSKDREAELEKWRTSSSLQQYVRHCAWNDAALAGALSGRPGVWLSMDHWIPLEGSCHSNPGQLIPDHGGQVLALAREANHRTVGLVQAEASLDWLSRQALQLATPAGGLNGFALQRVSRALLPLAGEEIKPDRARRVHQRLLELADFPGPEPASLALLAKTARRLCDLMRHLCGRVRLSEPRAVWADGPLEGPLWNALTGEFQRYLPELRWSGPDHPPEKGMLLLLMGEAKELERQALNPAGVGIDIEPFEGISDNAWRHVARGQVQLR